MYIGFFLITVFAIYKIQFSFRTDEKIIARQYTIVISQTGLYGDDAGSTRMGGITFSILTPTAGIMGCITVYASPKMRTIGSLFLNRNCLFQS